tara:strand:+ start:1425 stop:3326 length:1902 start_codon:yes stop_codon:yes gene_type:complete
MNVGLILKSLSRNLKLVILIFSDMLTAFVCWVVFGPPLALLLASNFENSLSIIIKENIYSFVIPTILMFLYFLSFGFYRSLMKFFDSKDSVFRALIGSFIFGFSWGIVYISQYEIIKTDFLPTVILQALLLSSVFYAFLQITRDIARLIIYPSKIRPDGKPILIYGAGTAGNELYQLIKENPELNVIGFFDNSYSLKGAEINKIKIYGKSKHLKKLVKQYSNLEIYLAIPSLNISKRRKIISSLEKYKVAVRSMPAIHEIVADEKKMAEIQDLSIDDILPREIVKEPNISFTGQSLLITGAGGSIGSEIVRQVVNGLPKKIVLFELSEINLYTIQAEVDALIKSRKLSINVVGILGDVKDKKRLETIISNHEVNLIYHAAAYKHVPIIELEENISEGIKNNILGTNSLCETAIECGVEKVVVVSTDKAVRPTNIMGASKRFAEMVVQSINSKSANTKFCMVRFGNVINSSGSVIPLFKKQISDGGPLTITHKNVTRYFMTISEASSLVIQAGKFAKGGDVFILDMGEQVKIYDLAEKLIYLSGRNIRRNDDGEGIEIREIGLRPGEKLYEELLISGKEETTPNDKIFKSNEKFPSVEEINTALKELNNYIETNDTMGIKNILKKYVEGFNEKN